ncbi:MAG: Mur ligase family protein [Cytophagales bacterium]
MKESNKKVHFIAIGGSVMHNLAIALKKNGWQVSGSDDEIFDPSKSKLEKYGLLPKEKGWNANNISDDLDLIILGMHAQADNPELIKAKELGLKISSFPEFIRDYSSNKQRFVIGGSHGKTTITAMIMHVLRHVGREFDYLVGAEIDGFELTVKLSDAPIIIIEGDEYLNSALDPQPKFLIYDHHIGVISGIKWDHYNVYPSLESYVIGFESFTDKTPKAGTLIYNGDDDIATVIGRKERDDVVAIEYTTLPHKVQEGITYLLTKNSGEIPLKIFGEHNMSNLSAALEVCKKLSIEEEDFYEAIKSFSGAGRRMELLAKNDNTLIFKDFAHAPSKLKASTQAVKTQYPDRELIACIELHTFSSLNKDFIEQYADTFVDADEAIIYYNPEVVKHKKLEMINENDLKTAFNQDDLTIFTESDKLIEYIKSKDLNNKNLLMMSSGNFDGVNLDKFAEKLLN